MTRTTISVPDDVHEQACEAKGDGETWAEYLLRCAETPQGRDEGQDCKADVPDIDDIGAEVERRVERALENHLTRR